MRRLKHAAFPTGRSDGERSSPTELSWTESLVPGGGRPEFQRDGEPLLAGLSPDLPIRAPAAGARYPSRRAAPHEPGAGDSQPRSTLAVAGILTMGFVMLGVATTMITRDLLVPAFARAAIAADEPSPQVARPQWPTWARQP